MNPVPFVFVDVFSDRPLEGNPLAVVPDADSIDEPTMRRIAREFNQSETTFLLKPEEDDADWHLRSFTAPGHEVTGVHGRKDCDPMPGQALRFVGSGRWLERTPS